MSISGKKITGSSKKIPCIIIITGDPGSGKTSFADELVKRLKRRKMAVSGFLAPAGSREWNNRSYEIQPLAKGKKIILASEIPHAGWMKIGKFFFNPEAVRYGNKILAGSGVAHFDIIIVDEIGPFEIEGKIWAEAVTNLLLERNAQFMIWVVRNTVIEKAIQKWNLQNFEIIDIAKVPVTEAMDIIISTMKLKMKKNGY